MKLLIHRFWLISVALLIHQYALAVLASEPQNVTGQAILAPRSLNPNPNPLLFPTKPEEVEIVQTQAISLQQAIELAIRNNPELQAEILTLQNSQVALQETQAALYPNVNLSSDLNRSQSASGQISAEQSSALNLGSSDTSSTALSGTLELSYDIYTSGERSANIRAAEAQVRFDRLDVERFTEELRLNVANDYYGLQQADEQIRINRAAVTNAEANLRDAQALEQAGVGTRFDVLQAQVELANAIQDLTGSLSQQQIARRQLAQRLSLAQSVNITATDPVEITGLWNLSLPASIVQAFQNRAELPQQIAQRNISQQRRRAALAANKPQVSLVASYDLLDQFNDGVGIADGYSLGGRVTMSLYDGGAARARTRQEEGNIAISETNFANTRNQIRFDVEQAYNNLQSNLANIQTSTVALEQAREALRLARLRFQAGVGTQTE